MRTAPRITLHNSVKRYCIGCVTQLAHLLEELEHVSVSIGVHELELLDDELGHPIALKLSRLELLGYEDMSWQEDACGPAGINVVQAYRMFALCDAVDMSSLLLQSQLPSRP